MKFLITKTLIVTMVVGAGCCTLSEHANKSAVTPVYICQWSNIEMTQGTSVVSGENPKEVSVDDLAKKGVSFRTKSEKLMECQAIKSPKELEEINTEESSSTSEDSSDTTNKSNDTML
tara:strand:- start:2634 stop:2987 length:354 start_codon:yes stop_codon:yes gene_type:complete